MEIETAQVPLLTPLKGWLTKLGWLGRQIGIWEDRFTRSQNNGILGQPRAIRMTLLHK